MKFVFFAGTDCTKITHKLYLICIDMASDEIKRVTFKLPLSEYERLEAYCKKSHRGKTEILREFIRSLPEPEPEPETEKKSEKK